MLTADKKYIILDLAGKAIRLRPELAKARPDGDLSERIADFARVIAKSIDDSPGGGY
jgi:hypothetical protein